MPYHRFRTRKRRSAQSQCPHGSAISTVDPPPPPTGSPVTLRDHGPLFLEGEWPASLFPPPRAADSAGVSSSFSSPSFPFPLLSSPPFLSLLLPPFPLPLPPPPLRLLLPLPLFPSRWRRAGSAQAERPSPLLLAPSVPPLAQGLLPGFASLPRQREPPRPICERPVEEPRFRQHGIRLLALAASARPFSRNSSGAPSFLPDQIRRRKVGRTVMSAGAAARALQRVDPPPPSPPPLFALSNCPKIRCPPPSAAPRSLRFRPLGFRRRPF